MRYWLNAGFLEAEQMLDVARAAERLSFDGITLPDHLFIPERIGSDYPYSSNGEITWSPDLPWPDCWVSIAAMAQATERLRFSTSVFVAPLRDVFSLAKSMGTAATFARGRLSCGLGAGWMREEFDAVGLDFACRGARMDEMLEVLPLLWSGDVVEYHGEHLAFGPLRMRPAAGRLPILIGGNTKPALRRAARCEGWIGTYTDVDDVGRMLVELESLRAQHGRSGEPFEIMLAAHPGATREATALDQLGVGAMIIPALSLAASTSTADVLAGLERFAARRMEAFDG